MFSGALVNSVFLVSLCLGMVIEVVERLIETEEIKEPKFLLLVGCIGLLINLIGLFVFGHSHSHNLPNVAEEDDDDDDDQVENQEAIKLMLAKENAASNGGQHNDEQVAVIVEPARNSEIKQKKGDSDKVAKKKPTKCHILCNTLTFKVRIFQLNVCNSQRSQHEYESSVFACASGRSGLSDCNNQRTAECVSGQVEHTQEHHNLHRSGSNSHSYLFDSSFGDPIA